jgi:hypothetical protein
MAEALMEEVETHALEGFGQPHLRFSYQGSIWDLFFVTSLRAERIPLCL